MKIELKGVQFVNKGAELMLRSIISAFGKRNIKADFVMEVNDFSPRNRLISEGILPKFNFVRKGIDLNFLQNLVLFFKFNHNYTLEREIDIIIDGSGFAYGDFWGSKKAELRLGKNIKRWKKEGKKVILLPQAFGPFTNKKLAKTMSIILQNADLVFARDENSFKFLKSLEIEKKNNLFLSPDFTNLTDGIIPENFDSEKFQVAIIPNLKILESKSFKSSDDYFILLKNIIEEVIAFGYSPYFLLHELGKDEIVSDTVNKLLEKPIPVIKEIDPLKIKGIIKTAKAVIGSRFHGLVSALAQEVPSLCIGWTHKYEALFKDYDFVEGVLDIELINPILITQKVKMILSPESRSHLLSKLKVKSDEQKKKTDEMWDKVFKLIES